MMMITLIIILFSACLTLDLQAAAKQLKVYKKNKFKIKETKPIKSNQKKWEWELEFRSIEDAVQIRADEIGNVETKRARGNQEETRRRG